MSARRILGLEQTFNCSPCGKPQGNNRAQNGEGHANECSTLESAWFTPWERRFPKSRRRTLLDSLMEMEPSWPSSNATRPNGSGSGFACGSRQPSCVNADVAWLTDELGVGQVRPSRACWEWLVKDQSDAEWLLRAIRPFARVKAPQIDIALQILEHRVDSINDLNEQAGLADALSALNVRSRGRRQNTAAMIQGFVSRND